MEVNDLPIRGRGAMDNPPNRFERLHYERDAEESGAEDTAHPTHYYRDRTQSIINYNDSPDVGFDASINPYRGCEHGCAYCYARPFHEYLGFSAGLDFETEIMVKQDAPELLRRELSSPRWQPQTLAISGVTDAYQPVERRLKLTRRCLEVLVEFLNPVAIITKSQLVTRDVDLLVELARHQAAMVFLSITTLDGQLARLLEPRAAQPSARLAAIEKLSQAGIPVGVMVAPIIPGLTDHEMPAILAAAAGAGAQQSGYTILRLPHSVSTQFEQWLTQHVPEKKDKVLERLRWIREGKLNDPRFKSRLRGKGVFADLLKSLFLLSCRKAGLNELRFELSTAAFRRPTGPQRLLFE